MTSSRRPVRRGIGATALALAAVLSLTGCFVVPLTDGRSPFDDPNGTSFAQRDAAVTAVREALDATDAVASGWEVVVEGDADNCEGACNLHVVVEILPPTNTVDLSGADPATFEAPVVEVPADVLADVLLAAAEGGEAEKVNVFVGPGRGEPFTLPGSTKEFWPVSSTADAVAELFPEATRNTETLFWISESDPMFRQEGFWIWLATRENTGVRDALGLD